MTAFWRTVRVVSNVLWKNLRSTHILPAVWLFHGVSSCIISCTQALKLGIVLHTQGNFFTLSCCDTLVQQLQIGRLNLIPFGLEGSFQ